MAILNFGGAEENSVTFARDADNIQLAISATVFRSGAYAYRVNGSGADARYALWGKLNGLGRAGFNTTSERFFTCFIYFVDLPTGAAEPVLLATGTTVTNVLCSLSVDSSGTATLVGATTSGTIATLSTATWYRVDMRVTSNGTSYCKIDGGSEQSCTANNFALYYFGMGSTASNMSYELIMDDFVIDDAAFPTYDPMVAISVPSGAGTYTGWTDGTGSTYAEVDDVPPDSSTTYIQNTSGSNVASTFTMQSKATAGGVGAIKAVMTVIIASEVVNASTLMGIRVRSGGANYDTATADVGSTSQSTKNNLLLVDPATSAAWTDSGFNAVEIGPLKGADTSGIRATAIYAHLLCDGVSAVPADLVLSTSAGAATATLAVRSPALLTLSAAASVATAAAAVISPALLSLAADGVSTAAIEVGSPALLSIISDGLSATSTGLSSPALLALSADGLSTAAATVFAPSLVVLSTSDGVSTAALEVITLAAGEMSLDSTIGVATASMAVSTTGFIVPGTSAGVATAAATLSAPTLLSLSAISGLSSASATVISPALLAILADATSTSAATVSTIAYLVPATIDGVATAALVVISPALLTMQADGVAASSVDVFAPANVIISATAGVSTAALAVKSPALLQLSADGLSATAIVVKSPALLSLTASGLASATALVRSPALMVIVADGTSLATISELSLGPSTKVRLGGAILLRPVLIQGGRQNVVRLGGGYSNPVRIPGGF